MKFATIYKDTELASCSWEALGTAEEVPDKVPKIKWEHIVTYPEDGMGFQLFDASWELEDRSAGSGWCLILGGLYLLPLFETGGRYAWIGDFSRTPSQFGVSRDEKIQRVKVRDLEVKSASKLPLQKKLSYSGLSLAPPPGLVGVPSVVLPMHFSRTANGVEAFYRFSAFANDKRVDSKTGHFAPDTYAAPYSEIPLVPSGYAAVGRYALPSFFPCCYVFRNLPVIGTPVEIGAVQPNFGQAGGGVEVLFPNGAVNQPGVAHEIRES
jgi:hypothetical protein